MTVIHLQDRAFCIKIMMGPFVIKLISIVVIAYMGFARASQVMASVASRFEGRVPSLFKSDLTGKVQSEATKAKMHSPSTYILTFRFQASSKRGNKDGLTYMNKYQQSMEQWNGKRVVFRS
jgi:hypothetical protein